MQVHVGVMKIEGKLKYQIDRKRDSCYQLRYKKQKIIKRMQSRVRHNKIWRGKRKERKSAKTRQNSNNNILMMTLQAKLNMLSM